MSALYLGGELRRAECSPMVLVSVIEHYMRRVDGQKRVIGTLLGEVKDGVCQVTSCYPVPHLEKDGEVAVGKDFNSKMLALQEKTLSHETKVVGWYATSLSDTGTLIDDQSCLMQEFFEGEYGTEVPPVLLVVDTALQGQQLSALAFVSSSASLGGVAHENRFDQLPLSVHGMAHFNESAAPAHNLPEQALLVDNLSRSLSNTSAGEPGAAGLAEMESKVDGLERSMRRLVEMLERTTAYVGDVVAGKETPDSETARAVADALAAVPRAAPEQFDKVFNDNLQDLLMVLYLSNLTRSQLAITDHLSLRMSERVAANKPQ